MKKLIFALLFFSSCMTPNKEEIINEAVRQSVKAQAVLWFNYLEFVENNDLVIDGDTFPHKPSMTEFYKMSFGTMNDTIKFYRP